MGMLEGKAGGRGRVVVGPAVVGTVWIATSTVSSGGEAGPDPRAASSRATTTKPRVVAPRRMPGWYRRAGGEQSAPSPPRRWNFAV